jgi:hypothetical protein
MIDNGLIDERSHPGFREIYGELASQSAYLDAAVQRIRLTGLTLGPGELGHLRRIRVLLGETNALVLSAEAETVVSTPEGRRLLRLLLFLLESGRMEIRIAPLAGWNPDFSVFTREPEEGEVDREDDLPSSRMTLMLGTHWLERPYPHPGPALGVVLHGPPALKATARFREIWDRGHDLKGAFVTLFRKTVRRFPSQTRPGLTPSRRSGYSLRAAGTSSGVDPV